MGNVPHGAPHHGTRVELVLLDELEDELSVSREPETTGGGVGGVGGSAAQSRRHCSRISGGVWNPRHQRAAGWQSGHGGGRPDGVQARQGGGLAGERERERVGERLGAISTFYARDT